MRRLTKASSLLVAITLLGAACGTGTGGTSSNASLSSVKFTMGYWPTTPAVSTAAVALGYFNRLSMTHVEIASGAAGLPFLKNGTYAGLFDVGEPAIDIAFANNIPIKIVWSTFFSPIQLILRHSVSGPAGLKGLKIASPSGSEGQIFLEQYLATGSLTLNDIKYIDLAAPNILAAFNTGSIDGAFIWPPDATAMIQKGGVLIETVPGANMTIFSQQFTNQHPNVVQEVVCAEAKTQDEFVSNPDAVYSAMSTLTGVSATELKTDMPANTVVSKNDELSAQQLGGTDLTPNGLAGRVISVGKFLANAGSIGTAPSATDVTAMIDPSFARGVLAGKCS